MGGSGGKGTARRGAGTCLRLSQAVAGRAANRGRRRRGRDPSLALRLARDALSRATLGGTLNANPIWSPDGKRLAFSFRPGRALEPLRSTRGRRRAAERLTTSSVINVANSWSPDGQTIAFIEVSPETGMDIWMVGLGDRKPRPFLKTQYNESSPKFSPDGRWLAYVSDESGRWEVYVQPFPGPGGKWQISTEGGTEPVWNPAGRELFYRMGNRMMAVATTLQPAFSADKPRVLFEGPWLPTPITFPNYDVSRRWPAVPDAETRRSGPGRTADRSRAELARRTEEAKEVTSRPMGLKGRPVLTESQR